MLKWRNSNTSNNIVISIWISIFIDHPKIQYWSNETKSALYNNLVFNFIT
jgi:hypothetical protein